MSGVDFTDGTVRRHIRKGATDSLVRWVTEQGGTVVKNIGDELLCTFPDSGSALLAACDPSDRGAGPTPGAPDPLAPLHDFEESRRKATDFAHLPASDEALGPDPYVVRALPGEGPPRFLALLDLRPELLRVGTPLAEIVGFNEARHEYGDHGEFDQISSGALHGGVDGRTFSTLAPPLLTRLEIRQPQAAPKYRFNIAMLMR